MHIEARLDVTRRPVVTLSTPKSRENRPRPAETSAETLDDLWLSTGLRRTLVQAVGPLGRSEEHQRRANARPRHASREIAAARRLNASPRGVRHLTAMSTT
jgi:hypothetical protein